jgi:SAM-dependent methyltransferase
MGDIGRWYVTQFVRQVARQLPSGLRLLDAGAGECAYKPFFQHCRYVGVDLAVGEPAWNYRNLDSIAELDRLPFAEEVFDAALSTQTLEHLSLPQESLLELHRVLRPGGKLFLTAPMAHAEHQLPYDFFRYTSIGLRTLCERSGFKEITVTPFGGMFVRWAYELPRALTIFPDSGLMQGSPHALGVLLLPLKMSALLAVRMLQLACMFLDRFDRRKDFPFGWALTARK